MLSFDPDKIALPAGHFINGQHLTGKGEALTVNRPSDGLRAAELFSADAALVDEAVTNADRAARDSGWASCPPDRKSVV